MATVAAVASVVGGAIATGVSVGDFINKLVSECQRSVTIHVKNNSSYTLINPQIYTSSGYCYASPQPKVGTGDTELCVFGQTRGTACGAVGVLTYDITKDQEDAVQRLAVMFSVPFDYNLYENWFALGLFSINQACDEDLYNRMYYNEGSFTREKAIGTEISYHSGNFTLSGSMTAAAKSDIKVHIEYQ